MIREKIKEKGALWVLIKKENKEILTQITRVEFLQEGTDFYSDSAKELEYEQGEFFLLVNHGYDRIPVEVEFY